MFSLFRHINSSCLRCYYSSYQLLVPKWILSSYVRSMASSTNNYFKRVVFNLVQGGPPTIYTFGTAFLLDELSDAQSTFRYATRNLLGLSVVLPGLPYDARSEAISAYLRCQAFQHHEQAGSFCAQTAPNIPLVVKEHQKKKNPNSAGPYRFHGCLYHVEIQDLADYGCPPAQTLTACRSSTASRAAVFAAWLRGPSKNPFQAPPPSSLRHFELPWTSVNFVHWNW